MTTREVPRGVRRTNEGQKMPTRQEITDELRQRFASADEAFLDMIGMFEQVLRGGQVVPSAVLLNALAQFTAAFGDTTDQERRLTRMAHGKSWWVGAGEGVRGENLPPNANLKLAIATPLGCVMLKRDLAERLQSIMSKVSDVPYEFPLGKVEPDNS